MRMAETLLEARAVSRSYPVRAGLWRRTSGWIRAVDRVTCALESGDTLGLVGESGCGKTTLARLFVGLLAPSEGVVLVRGRSWVGLRGSARLAARRTVQCIFQDPMNSLNPRMSVEEIVAEPLIIHRMTDRVGRRRRVLELLAMVQLPSSVCRRLPSELSGGERQRVGIARALALDPKALICDEPIASLDMSVGAQILGLLRNLSRHRRMALLFISHDIGAVASLCRRIAVMRQGRVVEFAETERVMRRPSHPYTQWLIRCAELRLDAAEPPPDDDGDGSI